MYVSKDHLMGIIEFCGKTFLLCICYVFKSCILYLLNDLTAVYIYINQKNKRFVIESTSP